MSVDVDRIYLYSAPATVVDEKEIQEWLESRTAVDVYLRDRFLSRYRDNDLAEELAGTRVVSPYSRDVGGEMLGMIRYEERALERADRVGGVIYDGLRLQRLMNKRIPVGELSGNDLHISLHGRVIGTWGDHDGRWHKRINVLGQPVIVSVPGLYEAPAKPEEYYKLKQKHSLMSGGAPPREFLESEVEGDFLVENDPRTTEALKGGVLQGYHYWVTGEDFCEDNDCRLYNPHRQGELVRSQLSGPEFCDRHSVMYR